MYKSCVVTFPGRETWAYLIVLNMVDFDVILGMDWFAPYNNTLDCYAKTITLALPGMQRIA